MSMTGKIICEFHFQCDKQWRDLSEILGEDGVRYCRDCTKPVFYCSTYEELAEHVAQSHCVAIGDDPMLVTVGFIASP